MSVKLSINTSREKIWNIISKIDNDLHYWKGITAIRNFSKNQNVTTREVTLVNGSKSLQKVTLFPKEGIHIRCTKGPIVGIKDILLNGSNTTILEVQMSYKLSDVVQLVPRNVVDDIRYETELALKLIKGEAENSPVLPFKKRNLMVDLINE